MCDRRLSLRDIAGEIGISFGAVQYILTNNLGISTVSARWVPRMLTKDQRKSRLDDSKHLLSLSMKMTLRNLCVELWPKMRRVHHFDHEAKTQSMQWKHPGLPLLRNIREFLQH